MSRPTAEDIAKTILRYLITSHGCWAEDMEDYSVRELVDCGCDGVDGLEEEQWLEITQEIINKHIPLVLEEDPY